jgi:hypothetical protein
VKFGHDQRNEQNKSSASRSHRRLKHYSCCFNRTIRSVVRYRRPISFTLPAIFYRKALVNMTRWVQLEKKSQSDVILQCYIQKRLTKYSVMLWAVLIAVYSTMFVASFDLYQEGYLNLERNKDRPNLPFAINTNRYADGYTSTSGSGEVTSSHFQVYQGAIGNTSDRYLKFASYMADAALQGLAGYGAGEATQENAKVVILNQLALNPNLPAPEKTFTVYAAIKWNPSNFAIQEGETYKVEVLGNQTGTSPQFWFDGGIRVNADGYESYYDAVSSCFISLGRCRSHLKKKRRFVKGNWMGLVCSIGEFVKPAEQIAPGSEKTGKYLPLDEAILTETLFYVGLGVDIILE